MGALSLIIKVVIAIFLPPVAVFLEVGEVWARERGAPARAKPPSLCARQNKFAYSHVRANPPATACDTLQAWAGTFG